MVIKDECINSNVYKEYSKCVEWSFQADSEV